MPLFRLHKNDFSFPSPSFAEPDGLLAVGGDLSPARLLEAYRLGIFPWYSEKDPLLWWSPDPRLVLFPARFHFTRRLARTMRSQKFAMSVDSVFAEVIATCANIRRRGERGTWITPEMQEAYIILHELGYAHSLECWLNGKLVGGLYGVCLDQVFFGESMFSAVADASKLALATLCKEAPKWGISLIDCQMTTSHLRSLGAEEVTGADFRQLLAKLIRSLKSQKNWRLSYTGKEGNGTTDAKSGKRHVHQGGVEKDSQKESIPD